MSTFFHTAKPTGQMFSVNSGSVCVCDMRPGITSESVMCRLPKGRFKVGIERASDSSWASILLTLEGTRYNKTQRIGEFSVDMSTIGIFDPRDIDRQFAGDDDAVFEWSGSIVQKSNWGGFCYDKQLGIGYLCVNTESDCTCTVDLLLDGRRKTGIRVARSNAICISLGDYRELIERFLVDRIDAFSVYENLGPGHDDDPVSIATIGFDARNGWVALIFDTRQKSRPDEEWIAYADYLVNRLEMPDWEKAVNELEQGNSVSLTREDGGVWSLGGESNIEALEHSIGTLLTNVGENLRKKKRFSKLPLSEKSHLVVDQHQGYFRWPLRSERVSLD